MKREKQISYNRPAPVEGLPESPELERAVLGALILEPDQLSDVTEIVGISAFSDPNNGKIYGAMLSMLEQGNKIDLCMLSQHPELKGREMVRYLVELTNSIGSAVNVLDHARQLADIEARRRLIMLSYEIAAKSSAGTNSAEEICELVTNQIAALVSTTARVSDLIPLSDAVRATIDNLELRQQERQAGQCIGIPTGLQRRCGDGPLPVRGQERAPRGADPGPGRPADSKLRKGPGAAASAGFRPGDGTKPGAGQCAAF